MFGDDNFYFSSFSDDLLKHNRDNALELVKMHGLGSKSLVWVTSRPVLTGLTITDGCENCQWQGLGKHPF